MLTIHTNLSVGDHGGKATTQLSHDFNSYCTFNGKNLGCAAGGVYELAGRKNGDEDISANFKTFNNTFGWIGKKRIRYIYVTLEADGDIIADVFCDDVLVQSISAEPTASGRYRLSIPVNRTWKGVYFSIAIRNTNGSWFSIDNISAKTTNLTINRK